MSIDQHLSRLRADHRSRNYSPLGPASGTSQNSANATANNIPYDAKALDPNSRNVKLEGYGYNRAQNVPSRTAATVRRRSNMPNVSFESMPPPPPRPRPPARIDAPMSSSPPPPPPPPPPPEVLAAAQLGLKASELRLPGNRRHVPPKKMSARKHLARQRIVPSVLLDSQGPFMKHVQETLSTQTRLVKKRLSTINRRNDLKMQMPFYLAAQQAFTELIEHALPAIEGSNLPPEIKSQLSQAWDRSNDLSKTIEQWQQLLEDDENDDLLKLESRCLSQEVELSKLLQDFDPHVSVDREGYLSEVSETLFPTNSRPPSTTSEHESIDSTTSVRQRYLRTIGTMNLLRDRIFNWESDLQLQSFQREQEREDGVILEQTDEDFFAEFDQRRREIVDEYWKTKEEMADTYQACQDEGLEVQQASLPPYLDQLFSLDSSKDIASTGKEDSRGLSESSRNIMHWAHHVQKMSQPDSLAFFNPVLTEKDAEDLLPFPQYQNLQASTDLHGPTGSVSGSRSVQRPPSRDFEGEIPTARRRYSAPMLIQGAKQSDDLQALDFQDANTRRMMGRRRESRSGLRRVKSEL